MINLLFRDRPPLDVPSSCRNTLLIYTYIEGKYLLVTKLISYRANVSVIDSIRSSPLYIAARKRNAELVSLLLTSGAELKAKDEYR